MSDTDTIDGLPQVHDYYAVAGVAQEDTLKLQLNWVEYSRAERKQIVRGAAYLCFRGVLHLARSTDEQVAVASPAARQVPWRTISSDRELRSVHELIEQIRHPTTTVGEPLNYLERVDTGIIVVSHLSGEYLIRAQTVEWCDHGSPSWRMS